MKERVEFVNEFPVKGYYFFKAPDYKLMMDNEGKDFEKKVLKNWDAARNELFVRLIEKTESVNEYNAVNLQQTVELFINETGLKFGDVLPLMRLALSGTMKGPGVFEMMELIGKDYVKPRFIAFFGFCNSFSLNN